MNTSLSGFLEHLDFSFNSSLKEKGANVSELAVSRIRFHRSVELILHQFLAFLEIFSQFKRKLQESNALKKDALATVKIALLSPDLYPETSDKLIDLIRHHLRSHVPEPVLLTRRKSFEKSDLSFGTLNDWADPKTLSRFDLVLVACSNANVPIVLDIVYAQDIETTIIYPALIGLETKRAKSIGVF
jgi:hypothetical protein